MRGAAVPDDLQAGDVVLRALQMADVQWLLDGYSDPTIVAQTAHEQGLSVDSIEAAMDMVAESKRRARSGDGFAVAICRAADQEPVGVIELDAVEEHDGEALLGFWVLEAHRGNRYASAAVGLAVQWAFGSLDVRRVWADVEGDNHPSLRVLRGVGLRDCGTVPLPPGVRATPTSLVLCLEADTPAGGVGRSG